MSTGRIPGPYVHQVKEDRILMYYDDTGWDVLGIGARKSGEPDKASTGPKPLVHVGGNSGSAGRSKAGGRNG